mmetsp:Transcript_4083/g.7852  ORF Transcript_4083/g.7852 Transcript_4083/m.7852 type:complete len:106 (+) Transcript_4083:254-571(+)
MPLDPATCKVCLGRLRGRCDNKELNDCWTQFSRADKGETQSKRIIVGARVQVRGCGGVGKGTCRLGFTLCCSFVQENRRMDHPLARGNRKQSVTQSKERQDGGAG